MKQSSSSLLNKHRDASRRTAEVEAQIERLLQLHPKFLNVGRNEPYPGALGFEFLCPTPDGSPWSTSKSDKADSGHNPPLEWFVWDEELTESERLAREELKKQELLELSERSKAVETRLVEQGIEAPKDAGRAEPPGRASGIDWYRVFGPLP